MIVPLDHPKITRITQQPTTRYNNPENFMFWIHSYDPDWLESISIDCAIRVHEQAFLGLIHVSQQQVSLTKTEFYCVFETDDSSLISILKLLDI